MPKATTTRREAPRSATSEEIAEENGRAEEARSAIPPEILELRTAVDAVLAEGRIDDRLLNQGWMPTTPAEVVAVLEEHAASLESAHDEIELLEARLARLEERLNPDADWQRSTPGNDEREPIDWLFDEFHREDGSRIEPTPDDFEGEPFVDIMKGYIRPATWSQLLDALRVVALDHEYVQGNINKVTRVARDNNDRVSILSRQLSGATNPADVAEAYVLGVSSSRECGDDTKTAAKVRKWWKIIRLWGDLQDTPVGETRSRMVKEVFELQEELTKTGTD